MTLPHFGAVGEGRFVLGVTTPPPARDPLPFTLIFEYGLPIGEGSQTRAFSAKSWHSLGSLGAPGSFSTEYVNSLQLLTQMFTSRGMGGALRVGRNALNQLRSNELALGPTWALREWRWDSETQTLKPATTVNNPQESFDSTRAQELVDWLIQNRLQVLAGTHMIPRKFLGATSPAVGD